MGEVQTPIDYPRGVTFEQVWAMMQENAREMREYREIQKIRDLKFEKMQENLGGLNRSLGDLIEILIAAHLWEKFPEYGLQRAYRRIPIYNEKHEAKTDIDILLVDTEWAMVIEVKRSVDNKEDINHHIKRMELILQYPPKLIEPQVKILSAIAGGVVTPEAAAYAHECGFYVLELAGESVVRVPDPPEFKPMQYAL